MVQIAGKRVAMLRRKTLSDDQAKAWMRDGELDEAVRADGDNVAVVLTQGWCPQWVSMNVWLNFMEKRERPEDTDITVYQFLYDKVGFFDDFRRFKEQSLGNAEIPFVLYYQDGELIGTTNYVTSRDFVARFARAQEGNTPDGQ
jgi:hypothetical protein